MNVSFSAQKNFGVANPEKQQVTDKLKKNLSFEGVATYRILIPKGKELLLGLNKQPVQDTFYKDAVTKATHLYRFIVDTLDVAGLRLYDSASKDYSVRLLEDTDHPFAKEGNSVLTFFTETPEIKQLDEAIKNKDIKKVDELFEDVPAQNVFKVDSIDDAMNLLNDKLLPKTNGVKWYDYQVKNLMNSWNRRMEKRLKSNLWYTETSWFSGKPAKPDFPEKHNS